MAKIDFGGVEEEVITSEEFPMDKAKTIAKQSMKFIVRMYPSRRIVQQRGDFLRSLESNYGISEYGQREAVLSHARCCIDHLVRALAHCANQGQRRQFAATPRAGQKGRKLDSDRRHPWTGPVDQAEPAAGLGQGPGFRSRPACIIVRGVIYQWPGACADHRWRHR